jgi:hypothetical protein
MRDNNDSSSNSDELFCGMGIEIRKHFESNCLCIANKDIELKNSSISDSEAISYYEKSCKCICNYVDANRHTIKSTRNLMSKLDASND